MIIAPDDKYLNALIVERARLQKELAPILTRAGGSNPRRKEINKQRAQQRKVLRRKLKFNAFRLAAHVCAEYRYLDPVALGNILHTFVYNAELAGSVANEEIIRIVDRLTKMRNGL